MPPGVQWASSSMTKSLVCNMRVTCSRLRAWPATVDTK